MADKKRALKAIEQCPDGHYYNSSRTGDVCAVCGKKLDPPEAEEMTPAELEEATYLSEKNWVCGWLVCVKGPNKGRGYVIRDGKNFIGSLSGMDIQVIGDSRIEKRNHAVVMYDSKQRKTMLLPADSHGMVYWKGQAVFNPVTLEPFDDVEFGGSVFKYAQFCGADFDWEDAEDMK